MLRGPRFLRISLLFLSAVISLAFYGDSACGAPRLIARAGLLMELYSGKILWKKNGGGLLEPASTTKILTALIAIEHGRLDDEVVISPQAAVTGGSRVGLQAGEKLKMEDLLYGLLLGSGNDAAVAVAEHVGGSVAGFAKLMMEKAKKIGAVHSRFRNPSGLPQEGHYTTAEDLALIARAALMDPVFRKIVSTRVRPWRSREWEGSLVNHNRLLGMYDGAIGVKTGFTQTAGQCLVAAAERGDEAYLAVVLNSRGKAIWKDATSLLDYGFHNYTRLELAERGETLLTSTIDGEQVPLAAAAPVHHLVARGEPSDSQLSIVLDELGPPIAIGDKLGEAVFLNGGKEIASVDLVSTVEVSGRRALLPLMTWLGWGLVGVLSVRLVIDRRRHRPLFIRRNRRLRF